MATAGPTPPPTSQEAPNEPTSNMGHIRSSRFLPVVSLGSSHRRSRPRSRLSALSRGRATPLQGIHIDLAIKGPTKLWGAKGDVARDGGGGHVQQGAQQHTLEPVFFLHRSKQGGTSKRPRQPR